MRKNKYLIACNGRGMGDKLSCYTKQYLLAEALDRELIIVERFAYDYFNVSERLSKQPNFNQFFISKLNNNIYELDIDSLSMSPQLYSFLKTVQANHTMYDTTSKYHNYDLLFTEELLYRRARTIPIDNNDDVILATDILTLQDDYTPYVNIFMKMFDINEQYILDGFNLCQQYDTFNYTGYHLRSCGWHHDCSYYWKPTIDIIFNDFKTVDLSQTYCCIDSLKTLDLIKTKYNDSVRYLKCQIFPENYNIKDYKKIRGHDTDLYSVNCDIFDITYYSFMDAVIFSFCKDHVYHPTSMYSFMLRCLVHYLKCNQYM